MQLFEGLQAARGILTLLFAYNLACVLTFATLYYAVGLDTHFNIPEGADNSFGTCMYYSFAVQSTCMAGEIYPKTAVGRGILSFQLLSAMMVTMILIVPWIRAARR